MCAKEPLDPQWHKLALFYSELRVQASYGVLDFLSLDLLWSLRLVRIDFELQDLSLQPIGQPFGEDLHHRSETLVGPSDPWLGLGFQGSLSGFQLLARLGATVPLGSTVENPFRLGREGQAHQHIQFGTGTVDPWAEIVLSRNFGRLGLSLSGLGKTSLYSNRHGYRAGTQLLIGLRGTSELRGFRFQLGVLTYHEEPERWSRIVETEGNLGRTDLMLETTIGWRFAATWSLSLGLKVPVWSRIVGAQLNTPALVDLSVQGSLPSPR